MFPPQTADLVAQAFFLTLGHDGNGGVTHHGAIGVDNRHRAGAGGCGSVNGRGEREAVSFLHSDLADGHTAARESLPA